MTSGTHLTPDDRERIVRLFCQRTRDGYLSRGAIARLLDLHRETVSAAIDDWVRERWEWFRRGEEIDEMRGRE